MRAVVRDAALAFLLVCATVLLPPAAMADGSREAGDGALPGEVAGPGAGGAADGESAGAESAGEAPPPQYDGVEAEEEGPGAASGSGDGVDGGGAGVAGEGFYPAEGEGSDGGGQALAFCRPGGEGAFRLAISRWIVVLFRCAA